MDELIYGVWKGRAYDNRRTIDGKAPEGLPLSEFLAFNSGNPVAGFAGPQGFLMFDNRVTLADVLLSYYKRVRELACGRCTPCRAGGVMIVEALEAACEGRGSEVDWERIRDIALQMKETRRDSPLREKPPAGRVPLAKTSGLVTWIVVKPSASVVPSTPSQLRSPQFSNP